MTSRVLFVNVRERDRLHVMAKAAQERDRQLVDQTLKSKCPECSPSPHAAEAKGIKTQDQICVCVCVCASARMRVCLCSVPLCRQGLG